MTLSNQAAAEQLEKMISTVVHREALPAPDGPVGKDMKPTPNSQGAASASVESANQAALNQSALVVEYVTNTASATTMIESTQRGS